MIADKLTTFVDNVASGASATPTIVGDVIDTQSLGDATNVGDNVGDESFPGGGHDIYLAITITEDYVGTSATDDITFYLLTSDTPGFTDSVELMSVNYEFGTGTDVLDAGDIALFAALPQSHEYLRYIGVAEAVNGATTTGKFSAFLTPDKHFLKSYSQADQ